jgi:2-phosphosulfolactate phosphatase
MNNIEVCLSPKLFDLYSSKNKIIIIVDILRASTMITTLFENGAKRIIPVTSLEEALEYKKNGFLVVAERNGKKVEFADFDNSPFSFMGEKVIGKTLVYSSTNGTNTINLAKNSETILIASFLNLSAVSDFLYKERKDILIVCSGWKGNYCIEDSLFAGALANDLINKASHQTICDSSLTSIDLWNLAKNDLAKYIQKISQYKRLKDFGFDQIVDYCFQLDISKVIPVYKEESIINLATSR